MLPSSPQDHAGKLRLYGLLRDIRSDAEHIRRQLPAVEAAAAIEDAGAREVAMAGALDRLRTLVAEDGAAIERRLLEARAMLDLDEALYDWGGDSVTEIENDWRDFLGLIPPPPQRGKGADAGAVLNLVRSGPTALDDVAYGVGLMTVPFRLNSQLDGVRTGGSLDFHAAFADEIPKQADRVRILAWLASQPAAVNGVVDLGQGRVYRAAKSGARRGASYLGLGFLASAGGLAFCLGLANLGVWFGLSQWPIQPGRFQEFLGAYVVLLLGAAAHLLISAIKQARGASGGGGSFLALEDWLLWVHVRELSIAAAIVSLWIGLGGLALLENPISAATAFFAGYSIDSVVDLFASRFQVFAGTRLTALEKRPGG